MKPSSADIASAAPDSLRAAAMPSRFPPLPLIGAGRGFLGGR